MIKLNKDITPIDKTSQLQYGMQLSPNVSIDLLTSGPVNPLTYPYNISRTEHLVENHFFSEKFLDKVPAPIKDLYSNRWKLASNLQYLAEGAMEPLLGEFGQDLTIYSAFIHAGRNNLFPESPHGTGEAIDIYVEDYQLNMFLILGEVMKMLKGRNVCEIGLCFNQRSWIHIGIAGPHHKFKGDIKEPRIFTRDFVTGEAWSGVFPARGLMK